MSHTKIYQVQSIKTGAIYAMFKDYRLARLHSMKFRDVIVRERYIKGDKSVKEKSEVNQRSEMLDLENVL